MANVFAHIPSSLTADEQDLIPIVYHPRPKFLRVNGYAHGGPICPFVVPGNGAGVCAVGPCPTFTRCIGLIRPLSTFLWTNNSHTLLNGFHRRLVFRFPHSTWFPRRIKYLFASPSTPSLIIGRECHINVETSTRDSFAG